MPDQPSPRIDAQAGIVYGARGRPVSKRIKGYVYFSHPKKRTYITAHRLIWESVHGPIPVGMQINHINGVKHDNRLCNLELVTPSGNILHAYRTGLLSAKGEKNGRALLTANDVQEIRSSNSSAHRLAEKFGVGIRTIKSIVSGRSWQHVAHGAAKGEA